ncbi:LysR family transcriptional regulator [Pikeienuella piscinae]|uniref:LysR family transcriptional regulator n=1 Tax=Pikeienuella piscinae TaxID=2748098 RepID=A0A7L5BYX0_9RHOB|nr:LysR family transcriptional regulator [Pikeienuella piscinae]QIE55084.1 LysR family transcriptional regulator [Pikeienuella piscinae]
MDTELARTFLTIAATGSFIAAAERLHITQSTVSARMRTLEEQLGASLFIRNRAGASLTDAGRRFQKHAALLVRTVEQAHHDVGLAEGIRASVTVGARIGLWDGLMLDWLGDLRRRMTDVSVRAEIGLEAELMQGLIDGRIDIGVMYTPQRRPNLELTHLLDEHLVLVSAAGAPPLDTGYIHVDWGPEFYTQHGAMHPALGGPALTVNIGWLGLAYLLANGGSGYFPHRQVAALIAAGTLYRPPHAPGFTLSAWLAYQRDRDHRVIDPMLASLVDHARRADVED